MEVKGKQLPISEPPGRWAPPNGTELLHSFRQAGSAPLSITRGFGSTPFR